MMSQSRSLGPAVGAAAALPVTGAGTTMMVLAGMAVLVLGLLMVRAARVRPGRIRPGRIRPGRV
jgi:LPXTG-motif cell wall-anchored protein